MSLRDTLKLSFVSNPVCNFAAYLHLKSDQPVEIVGLAVSSIIS